MGSYHGRAPFLLLAYRTISQLVLSALPLQHPPPVKLMSGKATGVEAWDKVRLVALLLLPQLNC